MIGPKYSNIMQLFCMIDGEIPFLVLERCRKRLIFDGKTRFLVLERCRRRLFLQKKEFGVLERCRRRFFGGKMRFWSGAFFGGKILFFFRIYHATFTINHATF